LFVNIPAIAHSHYKHNELVVTYFVYHTIGPDSNSPRRAV